MTAHATTTRPILRLDSPFSYGCQRCGRCCVGKRVQVNPYEIARIAQARASSTSEVRERFVTPDHALRHDGEGRCVFLGDGGCTVYAHRPLVCRIFPHARLVDEDGSQSFRPADRSQVGGVFGSDGTVREFIASQGATPFVAAADAYFDWYLRARERLDGAAVGATDDGGVDWLDMDSQIAAWCERRGEPEPVDIGGRLQLHLRILEGHLKGECDG